MNSNKGATKRERQRCANIVAGHHNRIRVKWATYKGEDVLYRKCLERVVGLLGRIHREIRDEQQGDLTPDAPHYQGDFSAEEMERALRVMEEQDQRNNPFEVST